jgi:hypothetical protein
MRKEDGRASGFFLLVVLIVLLLVPGGCVAVKMMGGSAPKIAVESPAKAIGRKPVHITITAEEPKYGVRDLHAASSGFEGRPLGDRPRRTPGGASGERTEGRRRPRVLIDRERIQSCRKGRRPSGPKRRRFLGRLRKRPDDRDQASRFF